LCDSLNVGDVVVEAECIEQREVAPHELGCLAPTSWPAVRCSCAKCSDLVAALFAHATRVRAFVSRVFASACENR
jgi:hypothetical protein